MITTTSNFSTFISGLKERLESINFGRRDKTLSNVYVLPGQTVTSDNQGVWTFKDGIISKVQLIAKDVGIKYVNNLIKE